MDQRIREVLRSLLINIDVLNGEVMRLGRSELFTNAAECAQLIERIRSSCLCSLETVRSIELALYKHHNAPAPPAALSLHE